MLPKLILPLVTSNGQKNAGKATSRLIFKANQPWLSRGTEKGTRKASLSKPGSPIPPKKDGFKMPNLNRYLVEALIEDYQNLNTNPETKTVDAAIVLEDAEGLPLIVSVKDSQPTCDGRQAHQTLRQQDQPRVAAGWESF